MMLFRPEGLFPSQRRRRELHIAEEMADDFDEDVRASLGGPVETPRRPTESSAPRTPRTRRATTRGDDR